MSEKVREIGPYPPSPAEVAKNRTWRTAVQAVIATAAVGAASAVIPLLQGNEAWTSDYWTGVGKTAAMGAVMALLAWVGAYKVPPKV